MAMSSVSPNMTSTWVDSFGLNLGFKVAYLMRGQYCAVGGARGTVLKMPGRRA